MKFLGTLRKKVRCENNKDRCGHNWKNYADSRKTYAKKAKRVKEMPLKCVVTLLVTFQR